MSRSNPNVGSPSPATKYFEWNGKEGCPRYYDKEKKERVELDCDFTFLYLDDLASVKGWDGQSKSGIHSNEVRDTRTEALVVRSKRGILASGFYSEIKPVIAAVKAKFCARVYIAFKDAGELRIGVFEFTGSALNAWVEFRKKYRKDIDSQAVRIKGYTEGKKGSVVFRVPIFTIQQVAPATDAAAKILDKELQEWLVQYFATRKAEPASPQHTEQQQQEPVDADPQMPEPDPEPPSGIPEDPDCPF